MNARHASLAASIVLAALASPLASAIDWGGPASAGRPRQAVALPPSPCKPGAVDCLRQPATLPPSPCKPGAIDCVRAPVVAPQGDDAVCEQKADGTWCTPGKLVLCAGHKAKASQVCHDGCNSTAHPPACAYSATGAGL